ncbi:collagenase-like [Pieris brassicae]|uniref:collagenase-like n=1 Tax=Pieris brassicae TaxID=7116 RepID=UPI001E661560|nr:collagenase-like [Pieris brassicae]
MKLLILISVIAFAVAEISDYHEKIGIPLAIRLKQLELARDFDGSRIFGGHEAPLGAYPHMAGLVIPTGYYYDTVCGAALISSTRVLTAAHCMISDARNITVVLGSRTIYYGGVRVKATEAVNHPGWDMSKSVANDIAVMFIPPVTFTDIIQPINLYTGSSDLSGVWASISGFGITGSSQSLSPDQSLKHMQTQVISNEECQTIFTTHVLESNICTRSGDNKDNICSSDSGGPLSLGSGRNGFLIGVVSFGASNCEIGQPAAYARVSFYAPWIRSLM